jgi:hypothetical protein
MIVLLSVLVAGMVGYWRLTDPNRVRDMAEAYLSDLLGGPVHVEQATLSVFEGFKLYGVTVKVDASNSKDSMLFVADAFDIQYDPAALLQGKLEATRIIATGPHVYLVENVDEGRWNYQRLTSPNARYHRNRRGLEEGQPLPLPEIVLRNARVEYSEIRGKQNVSRGAMAIEGRLSPSPDRSHYSFELQSRGAVEGVGPVVTGSFRLDDGEVNASLTNFHFGRDVQAMLPSEVRDWWASHQLEGRLNIPDFSYTPATTGHAATFHLETQFDHVKLVVHPQEMGGDETVRRLNRNHEEFNLMRLLGLDLTQAISSLERTSTPPEISVEDVSGTVAFDDNGITFNGISGSVDQSTMTISGKIDGYTPDAPLHLRLESPAGGVMKIPQRLDYVSSLPEDARQIYELINPHGLCKIWVEVDRKVPGARPEVAGELNVIDGEFSCKYFPYPIQGASGMVIFGREPHSGFERVEIQNVRGHGVAGGPNEKSYIVISGWVGPFDNTVGCNIRAETDSISSEPAIFDAFPKEVRDALQMFRDPRHASSSDRYAGYPHFHGKFVCDVIMPIGPGTKPVINTDIAFDDAGGWLSVFPYPLDHARGILKVREGSVEIVNAEMNHGEGWLQLNGRVTWPTNDADVSGVKPDLKVTAKNIPIDDDLLGALPPDKRDWLKSAGFTGKLDIDGRVFTLDGPSTQPAATIALDRLGYDFNMHLHDAAASPVGQALAASDVDGQLRLTQSRFEVRDLHGRRGEAELSASATADWGEQTKVTINASAHKLALDDSLYKLLPPAARDVWDAINPHGMIDADLVYDGNPAGALSKATTQSGTAPIGNYALTLRPRDLSVTPKAIPYRLDQCGGSLTLRPDGITLDQISGRHGNARLTVSGTGVTGDHPSWDLKVLAEQVAMDNDLAACLPQAFKQALDAVHLKGDLTLELKKFKYRAAEVAADPPQVDFSGTLYTRGASLDIAVPVDRINGSFSFDAAIRDGRLNQLSGDLTVNSMRLADRPVRDLKAELEKPADVDALHISRIQGELAGGEFAGGVNLGFPNDQLGAYSLDVVLKNADVRTIAGTSQDLRGQLSASLALQGEWSDASTRRGRGDVLVTGKKMYQIPLLLGLFEVTNLSLPNTNPFSEGTARYAIDGYRVTFDQLQMRSDTMVMDGSGWLDFGSKQVRLNFSTENPNWPHLPFIHDLLQGAKEELMQIQVRGTVQDPKVSASSLHTLTTTVDEVFTGSDKEK